MGECLTWEAVIPLSHHSRRHLGFRAEGEGRRAAARGGKPPSRPLADRPLVQGKQASIIHAFSSTIDSSNIHTHLHPHPALQGTNDLDNY